MIVKNDRPILNKGTPDTKSTCPFVVWNTSNFARSFQTNKHNFFKFTFIIACNLYFFLAFLLPQYDSMIFSFCARIEYSPSMTQKRGLDWTLLVFEKFTFAYLFQIALKIMWLPIRIGRHDVLLPINHNHYHFRKTESFNWKKTLNSNA